jgi:hypothetical protein
MEKATYQQLDRMEQMLNALVEKVYAKEINEQQTKEREAKNNQKLTNNTPSQSEEEEEDEFEEIQKQDGYDTDGTLKLKMDPEKWEPEPYDDGIIDEEDEAQEFQQFKEQADIEDAKRKAQKPKLNIPENKILPSKPRRNIFKTED